MMVANQQNGSSKLITGDLVRWRFYSSVHVNQNRSLLLGRRHQCGIRCRMDYSIDPRTMAVLPVGCCAEWWWCPGLLIAFFYSLILVMATDEHVQLFLPLLSTKDDSFAVKPHERFSTEQRSSHAFAFWAQHEHKMRLPYSVAVLDGKGARRHTRGKNLNIGSTEGRQTNGLGCK